MKFEKYRESTGDSRTTSAFFENWLFVIVIFSFAYSDIKLIIYLLLHLMTIRGGTEEELGVLSE